MEKKERKEKIKEAKLTKRQRKLNAKIRKAILEVAVDLAKRGEGALFIVGEKIKYELLFPNLLYKKKISIFKKDFKKVLEKLATIDGAVIISPEGIVKAYGARIKNPKTIKGYGTRHAAACGGSRGGNLAILVSEEEKNVKIFKDGKLIMQLNPFAKNIGRGVNKAVQYLDEAKISEISALAGAGVATGSVLGISASGLATMGAVSAGTAGIAIAPGVILFLTLAGSFAGSYYLIKKILTALTRKKKRK